jgi:hypothetical protein
MHHTVHRSILLVVVGLAVACSSVPEQQVIKKYFDAAKLRDQTTLANVATVQFDRDREGIVERFRILNVASERKLTLKIREYAKAYDEAKAADEALSKKIRAYQDENREAINRVVRAEARKAKVSGKDVAVQAAWSKWRQEMAEHAKRLSASRKQLAAERRAAELSTYDARRPVDLDDYEGELISKDVTIDAQIRKDGQVSTRKLVVTLEKADIKGPEGERRGRWIITAIRPA